MNTLDTGSTKLSKWHVYHIWREDITPKHFKYCLCICPIREWYFFINSKPSPGKIAYRYDVVVQNFELNFLSHESYIDTSSIKHFSDERVTLAIQHGTNLKGPMPPFLVKRVIETVQANPSLTQAEKSMVLGSKAQDEDVV